MKPGAHRAVFFLGPYATPMSKLRWAIWALQRAGYSVVTYEYSREIFKTGEPERLFAAVKKTRVHIKASIKELQAEGYTEFGFVGSSLGSFIAYNCMGTIPELSWGILNTGGNLAEAIWSFQTERQHFEEKGFTLPSLKKAWHSLQYAELGDMRAKRHILITSKGDKTLDYKGALACLDLIKTAGSDVNLIMHKRLGHRATVARNLFRIQKLVKKVKK
jgi:hypothetical protein